MLAILIRASHELICLLETALTWWSPILVTTLCDLTDLIQQSFEKSTIITPILYIRKDKFTE